MELPGSSRDHDYHQLPAVRLSISTFMELAIEFEKNVQACTHE